MRFHDGRHTALTRLCEAGQPDWVIQAQMGHVSPMMMKAYSHIRRQALQAAAKALEPTFALEFPTHPERPRAKGRFVPCADAPREPPRTHGTGPDQRLTKNRKIVKFTKEIGSSGWIRAENARRRRGFEA